MTKTNRTRPRNKSPRNKSPRNKSFHSTTSHRERILKHLMTLKIPMSAETLDRIVRESTEKNYSSWEMLERFLAAPADARIQAAITARVRRARFPTQATLESFDWSFNAKTIPQRPFLELATGAFIGRR